MNRRKIQKEIKELVRVAEINPNTLPDGVRVIESATKINQINNKKIVAEAAKTEIKPEEKLDIPSLISQTVKATVNSQEAKLAAALQAKNLEIQKEKDAKEQAVKEALEAQKKEFQAQLEKKLSEAKESHQLELAKSLAVIESKNKEVEQAKTSEKRLADVFKLHGNTHPVATKQMKTPGLNTLLSSSRDRLPEAITVLESLRNEAPSIAKYTKSGEIYTCHNFVEADRYIQANRKEVIQALEQLAKAHGLLVGSSGKINANSVVKQAATQISDIPGGFLPTLSAVVRMTHRTGLVFWQFAQTAFDYLKGHGSTIDVYRSAYAPASVSPADWQLSGGGSFVVLDTNIQQVQTGIVPIVVQEYGMGKPSTANQPIASTAFVMAYSMIDLISIIERNLGRNYAQFEERTIRSLYNGTSVICYNSNSSVVNNPASVAASTATNPSGILTKEYLTELHSYIYGLQVEPFPDGNYALVLNPKQISQLKNSLLNLWRIVTPENIEAVTSILNNTMIPPETGKISGYVGTYYGFHVFETNAFGVGAPSSEGVQTETVGSTSGVTTRTGYAFGSNAVGRGIGTPMEIRQNEITNYQRLNSFIWRSEEGFAALDVDPTGYSDTSAVPQQLRVFQIRTTDAAA